MTAFESPAGKWTQEVFRKMSEERSPNGKRIFISNKLGNNFVHSRRGAVPLLADEEISL